MICQTCNAPSTGDLCQRCRDAVARIERRSLLIVERAREEGRLPRHCACHRPRRRGVCAEQLAFAWRVSA